MSAEYFARDEVAQRRSYSQGIVGGAVVALFLVALGAVTLFTTYSAMQTEERRQLHVLAPASQHLADSYRYFIDQETAMRGYVISQRPDFLQPYRQAETRLPYHLDKLRDLMREIPDGETKLQRIEAEYQDWRGNVAEVEISLVDQGNQVRAFEVVESGLGKQKFDEIRAAVRDLEDWLAVLRSESDQALALYEGRLAVLLVFTLLGMALLIGLAGWLMSRRVVKPLTSEIQEQAGLIELSQDAIVTREVEGPITFWSRGAEALYGYSKEEAVGRVMRDLLRTKFPEPKPAMQERFFRDGFWTGLLTHTTKGGEEVMVASRWMLRRDEHGIPESIFEVNTNVSDRALTALKSATEEQFRQGRLHKPDSGRPQMEELQKAIADGDILAHYQPIVRLADHQIVGLEALMRWNHPERGLVLPDQFLQAALQTRLMDQMSQMVLERALADLAAWQSDDLFVSVNLESRQLLSSGLPKRLGHMIERAQIDPRRIWLEIPESLYAEHFSGAVQVVSELRDIGCTIALDDFGTGTSSLDWLARVPVDALKVDRRFVKGIGRNPGDHAVLRAVAGLAQELGLVLVSEGIETVEQRDLLWELGYDFGQGFLFSKAVEQDDLIEAVLPGAVLREDLFGRTQR